MNSVIRPALVLFTTCLVARAALVTPVAVSVSNGEDTAEALIDGLGLTDDPPTSDSAHDPDGSLMWSSVGSINAWATFDLGGAMDITNVYVWNYNASGNTPIGMKDVEVQVSHDPDLATARFTTIAHIALEEGGEGAQSFDLQATDVRWIRLNGLTNWGHGFSVGLAEVRFESGDIAGHTPFVEISHPQEGDVIPFGSSIDLTATIEDEDGDLDNVEFFDNDVLLGSDDAAPYTFSVADPAKGEHVLRVKATDTSGKAAWSTVKVMVRDVLIGEIIQIDDEADIGEGINQITYSDNWNLAPGNENDPRFNNNDHYSDVKDSWFEVEFTGAKIDIFATVASHHGTATAQIDDGTEFSISYQAEQRGEQVLVWSSPLLPNREHVLRVTVDGTGVVTADRFDVHVPTTRVIQVDDEADIGEGLNQITYSEGWNLAPGNENDPRFNNNDHYSGNQGNWFEVRFVGVKIELYATVASHHGTATASIDGGTETVISYQTEQRGEQVLVWESPILPNREHVLRVTVDGTGVVTADRFDIHVSDDAGADLAAVNRVDSSLGGVTIAIKDFGDSMADPASIELRVDGILVEAAVKKEGDTTTISYTPPTPYAPGSEHDYAITGMDTNGNALSGEDSFIIPAPPFSLQGLGGPQGRSGVWGIRQIWDTGGLINSLAGAVEASLAANREDFAGTLHDGHVPIVNFSEDPDTGAGLFFEDEEPMPGEVAGLTDSDYVSIAHGFVRIPSSGDWTVGIHANEGFALRFIGASFSSASGQGVVDSHFPEYLIHPTGSDDSNTRGVLQGLEEGIYEIEVISWERAGGAHLEIYAAEGAFADDAETDSWALIGSADGLELVGTSLNEMVVTRFALENGDLLLDFASPEPGGIHEMQRSVDLITWTPVESTFVNLGEGVLRGTAMAAEAPSEYVRAVLMETPPFFFDDFESGAEGWVTGGTNAAETQWELGDPTAGPGQAFSGENVFGTDLDGSFAALATVSLRSPVIDLEGQEGRPRLKFQYYIDATEGSEGGRLNFRDENGELLFNDVNLIFWGTSTGWEEYNRPVPTEVRGRRFILEFELLSDEDEPNGAGWYIDDVEVSK